MKRITIVVSLSLSLVAVSGIASAQEKDVPFIVGNIDGTCVTSAANAGDWTITCGDITPGSGITVIEPPLVDSALPPLVVAPEPESGPSLDPAPVDESMSDTPVDAASDDTARATDTDVDSVADADEVNFYGTDPFLWDTDGDGLSDGDELFVTGSDPLTWDTDGDGISDGDEGAAGTDPLDPTSVVEGTDGSVSEASGVDSDNDRLADADEAGFGTDPTTPDSDGDGYYDGDEVILGADPLDPASFPTEESPPASA